MPEAAAVDTRVAHEACPATRLEEAIHALAHSAHILGHASDAMLTQCDLPDRGLKLQHMDVAALTFAINEIQSMSSNLIGLYQAYAVSQPRRS